MSPENQLLLTVSRLSAYQRHEMLHRLLAGNRLVAGSSPFAPVHLLPFGAETRGALRDAASDAVPDLVDQLLALPAERQRALGLGLLAACPLEADGNRIALPVQPAGTVAAALRTTYVSTAPEPEPEPEPEPAPVPALTFHGPGGTFLAALDTTATRLILRSHVDTPDVVRWLDYAAVAPLRVEALRDPAPEPTGPGAGRAATPSWSCTIRQKSGAMVLLYADGKVTCYDPVGSVFCTVDAEQVIYAGADPAARSRLLRTAPRV